MTVGHLQHMIGCKHELPAGRRIELLARGEVLTSELMLLDVAYLHCWRRVNTTRSTRHSARVTHSWVLRRDWSGHLNSGDAATFMLLKI